MAEITYENDTPTYQKEYDLEGDTVSEKDLTEASL